ncbi:MAG: hypothetical protein AB7T86_09040 [Xanthobacteraceae bacterium]|uniref:hypothetical protein n=1 Tax=Pseudolabrys sp. TaxID=1960880 RepID=UPI003D0CE6DC
MSVVGAANAIDWVTSAWNSIQSQSSGTGIAILDAVTGADSSLLSDGLGIDDGLALASQLSSIQINQMQGLGTIAGQMALDRIQSDIKNKFSSIDITV